MIIKFTVTLSDATVAAFAKEGATTGQDIKSELIEVLQAELTRVRDETEGALDDNDPDDDEEDDEAES